MKNKSKIIVVTGAESTGKSTLAKALANHFSVPFIPEFAREYVENLNRNYTFNDVETIARKQVEQLHELLNSNSEFIILDTWLIITKIWFDVVFNQVPDWIDTEIRKTKIDLFLVCNTDLPWVADDVRENGGDSREILHKTYIKEITKYGFNYNIVNGRDVERLNKAIEIISNLK
ncbi:MAG: ATP-binding protein [Bacteroidota bacterium]